MKALLTGAAAALAAGLFFGDELKPQLWTGPYEMEPAYGDIVDAGLPPTGWSRPGPAPDYVVGSDWLLKPYVYEDEPLDVSDPETEPTFAALTSEPPAPPPPVFDQPLPETVYPSMGGGVLVRAAAAPEPPPAPPNA